MIAHPAKMQNGAAIINKMLNANPNSLPECCKSFLQVGQAHATELKLQISTKQASIVIRLIDWKCIDGNPLNISASSRSRGGASNNKWDP